MQPATHVTAAVVLLHYIHTLVRTSKTRCNRTITFFWVRQTFLDIQIPNYSVDNDKFCLYRLHGCGMSVAEQLRRYQQQAGPRSATAIMRQQPQARHFATWYSYRTSSDRTSDAGNITASKQRAAVYTWYGQGRGHHICCSRISISKRDCNDKFFIILIMLECTVVR